jgi:hypothetical protein
MDFRICLLLRERVFASRCVAMDAHIDSNNPALNGTPQY